jgi:phage terminase large subunit GpA-like protein
VPQGEEVRSPRAVGFHVPAVLARSVSLSALLARRMAAEASDDPAVKMQFANDDLGIPHTPVEVQTDETRVLSLREAWLPPRAVPQGAVAVTCGIDMQKRGFWFLVRAWMPNLSSFVIDYGTLEDWDQVRALVFDTHYPVLAPGGVPDCDPDADIPPHCLTGELMPVWRAGLDTGGTDTDGVFTRTEEAYMWVRANGGGVVHACKGASHAQTANVRRVIRERMPHNGRPIPGGLPLYLLDTGTIKTVEFSRMLNPENTQPLRLHAGCGQDLAEHLSSERQVRRGARLAWERKGGPNHLLDCLMLSGACADATWTPSLPHYVLQLRQEERARHAPRPAPKKKERPQPHRRWG